MYMYVKTYISRVHWVVTNPRACITCSTYRGTSIVAQLTYVYDFIAVVYMLNAHIEHLPVSGYAFFMFVCIWM